MKRLNLIKIFLSTVAGILIIGGVILFWAVDHSNYLELTHFKNSDLLNQENNLEESYLQTSSTIWMEDFFQSSSTLASSSTLFKRHQFTQFKFQAPKDLRFVPILMYHHIRNYPRPGDKYSLMADALSVSPFKFKEQIQWLAENNYVTITPSQLVKYFHHDVSFGDKKPIMLTFDDGFEDAYKAALPILESNKQIGVFYIISGYAGRKGYLSKEEIKELDTQGMVIASHTRNHPNLHKLSIPKLTDEIKGSKDDLEKLIGHSMDNFAYPYGDFSKLTEDVLKNSGYATGVIINPILATEKNNLLTLPRIWAYDSMDISKMLP